MKLFPRCCYDLFLFCKFLAHHFQLIIVVVLKSFQVCLSKHSKLSLQVTLLLLAKYFIGVNFGNELRYRLLVLLKVSTVLASDGVDLSIQLSLLFFLYLQAFSESLVLFLQ